MRTWGLKSWVCAAGPSLVAVAAIVWLGGCSKSPPVEPSHPGDSSNTNPTQSLREVEWRPPGFDTVGPTNAAAALDSNSPPALPPARAEKAAQVASWEKSYRSATGFDDRFEAAIQIGQVGTPEAVLALARLFREERDKDLRVELVNALIGIGGCKEERLEFLKLALPPEQPAEVREAAIDGLVDLEDARALPLLRGLFDDPDPAIRTLARQSHELVEAMLQAQ